MLKSRHKLSLVLAVLLALTTCGTLRSEAQSPTVTDLFSFTAPLGSYPYGPLIQGSDGYYYGTTQGGGLAGGFGTVFRMDAAANITILHHFNGADGAYPTAGLAQGTDGYFYGTTSYGGPNNTGTIFKMAPDGTFVSLYAFSAATGWNGVNSDGAQPNGLIQGSDGWFYGTAQYGGTSGMGTNFKISPSGSFVLMYSYTGTGGDGANPQCTLVRGSDGGFYGTTLYGGAYGYGTLFRFGFGWTPSIEISFDYNNIGAYPGGGLVSGSDGKLYGTTLTGGPGYSYGTIFSYAISGALTTLHVFTYANAGSDGAFPEGGLIQASDGNFYGTTSQGGPGDWGTVFQMTSGGSLATIYGFDGSAGAAPASSLVQGSDGNLYGTTPGPGGFAANVASYGSAFSITTGGALVAAHVFDYPDGQSPFAGVIQASDGNLYGTTVTGGAYTLGAVFALSLGGAFNLLYSFNGADGGFPEASLIQASNGNLYGSTAGLLTYGTLFTLPPGGPLTGLYAFSGSDGSVPRGNMIQGADGSFYGTTVSGGANYNGTIYRVTSGGALTTLYTFSALTYDPNTGRYDINSDGASPFGGLIQASDGNFYGTTDEGGAYGYGTVFRITPGGTLTVLYTFTGGADGLAPSGSLVQASDGYLYGATGTTLFRMTLDGTLTTLYTFTGGSDGFSPNSLFQAGDGNLYGTTAYGGANNMGTIFQLTLGGAFTTLYAFSGPDGQYPIGAFSQAMDGALYGATQNGGQGGAGVVYRMTGLYPLPALSALSPASRDAGAPGFTLIVKGASFQPFSQVHFNGTPVSTAYVSSGELKAAIPASLIASPGKVPVTVVTTLGGASTARTFTLLVTTLKLTAATLTKNSTTGVYTARVSLKNEGYLTAPNVKLTKAALGAAATSTTLPVSMGNIAASASGATTLTFPKTAGTSGTTVTLKVSGTFTGGKFAGSLKVKLP